MQQKAKPLTKDVFMQRCQGTIIRAQDARAIVRNECFTSCTSRNEQMLFVRHTHTQCVFHIIRLRLIIFHTPKNFNGRNIIE